MTIHFLAACAATPWAMEPTRLRAYAAVLLQAYQRKAGRAPDYTPAGAVPAILRAMEDEGPAPTRDQGIRAAAPARAGGRTNATAVIPITGAIVQRASQMDLCDSGTTTQAISQALREANADDTIGSILLDIDSPGGSVYGVAELAAEIRASAKPVVAIANSLAASAAYWLGAQATEFYCTPGGEVGSIGVWMAHEDVSQMLAEAGVNITLISAGQYKTEGNPYGPLPDEARAFLQSRTDDYYTAFTADVAKGRGAPVAQVRAGMGQGRVLGAQAAQAENMVNGVMTFDQAVRQAQRLGAARPQPAGRRAADAQRRTTVALALLGAGHQPNAGGAHGPRTAAGPSPAPVDAAPAVAVGAVQP